MKVIFKMLVATIMAVALVLSVGCEAKESSKAVVYQEIQVDGGDMSGERKPLVKVDIGYGERIYWAYTNEYGQLVRVEAQNISLQNAKKEKVNKNGRYYKDEAKVPGVEKPNLDQGHVIADSLGGVSNAYNITPQNSTLNRHGDQAYMEKVIREAGGCSNFVAEITYPNTETQIPSHYKFSYVLKGNQIVDEFENVDPDKVNQEKQEHSTQSAMLTEMDLNIIDTNGDGLVSIQEAKKAGFKMPIKKGHWLYPHMMDKDQDGLVGE